MAAAADAAEADALAAIVLAAGGGRRMGYRPKALLRREGVPLIQHQIGVLCAAGVRRIVVVLGHHADLIEPVLRRLRDAARLEPAAPGTAAEAAPVALSWVRNPAPDAGPASSLRAGLAALPAELGAVLVALADQPLLQAEDAAAVIAAWPARAAGTHLLLPVYAGQPGHPLIFDAHLRQAVQQGEGVREWRRAHPDQVALLAAAHPRYTQDVDTPDELRRIAEAHGLRLGWAEAGDGGGDDRGGVGAHGAAGGGR